MAKIPVVLKYSAYFALFTLVGEMVSRVVFPWMILPAAILTAAMILRDK